MAIARIRRNQPAVRNRDLVNYGNIFDEFDRMFGDVAAPFFSQGQGVSHYPADLYETNEHLVLEMAVPGLQADNLDISIEGRQLTVRGTLPEVEGENERRYWLTGIPRGEFTRTFTLPTTVVVENVQATIHNGVLTLTMPKVAEAQARKIAVTNG